jgi:ATP-dependent protease ClpP protease subunit
MNANEVDEFTLVINSPGGILDSAFMVADAITRSQASVSAYVVGTVASAATIVALACDKLEASENLAFMIHNYSSGIQGKGHEMKARQTFIDNELNKSFERYYLGFLSKEEITDVIEGKDIWLNSQEVMQRWEIKQKNTLQFKQAS